MTISATRPGDDPAALAEGVRRGEPAKVARMLSLVEAGDDTRRAAIASLTADGGHAYTIGITGAPGAGKSSLTDRFDHARARRSATRSRCSRSTRRAHGPAVPSSATACAWACTPPIPVCSSVRWPPAGTSAVSPTATPQAIRVLDATGTPWILVETVGVGQVELEIADAADTTVVVVNPGWGDGVQANKAGLLEVADVFVVNKADRAGADAAVKDLVAMLDLGPHLSWTPPIVQTVATTGDGIDALWDAVARAPRSPGRDGSLGTSTA